VTPAGVVHSFGSNSSAGGGGHGSTPIQHSGQLGREGDEAPAPVLWGLQVCCCCCCCCRCRARIQLASVCCYCCAVGTTGKGPWWALLCSPPQGCYMHALARSVRVVTPASPAAAECTYARGGLACSTCTLSSHGWLRPPASRVSGDAASPSLWLLCWSTMLRMPVPIASPPHWVAAWLLGRWRDGLSEDLVPAKGCLR
jgi:hypothetical protein